MPKDAGKQSEQQKDADKSKQPEQTEQLEQLTPRTIKRDSGGPSRRRN